MRDDFAKSTRDALARRAAHICSNPQCNALTIGPHSDPDKSLNTGHAAHIHAASPQGPRYEADQTSAQRRSIQNGVWLCRNCGPRVDSDAVAYPADMLRAWRRDHEALIREVGQHGYASTWELLRARRRVADDARAMIALLDNHAALWESFDAEFPDRVRQSLDRLRDNLTARRSALPAGSPIDAPSLEMIRAIQSFFRSLGRMDLAALRCDSRDPEWRRFSDALAALRGDLRQRVAALAAAYQTSLSPELARMA